MKLRVLVTVLFSAWLFCACQTPAEKTPPGTWLISNASIVDVETGEVSSPKTIAVHENRIWKIGEAADFSDASQTTSIDLEGRFVIPGLWDAHVHLTFVPELEQDMFRLFVANGITSVRDTGGLLEKILPHRDKSRSGTETAPRVFLAGPLVDGVPSVYDGSVPFRPEIAVGAPTPEAARAWVDSLTAVGADLVKSYEMLTPEAFRALLERAREKQLKVTGHVPLHLDAKEASNLGLSSMEHLRNLEFSASRDADSLLAARKKMMQNEQNLSGGDLRSQIHRSQRTHAIATQDADRRAELISTLKANDTWQIPTMTIVTSRAFRLYDNPDWLNTFSALPQNVESQWREIVERFSPTPPDESALVFAEWALGMVNDLHQAEVNILAGTDTPIFPLTPGFSLHEELLLLEKSGLSPLAVLQTATINPAKYFGLENDLGTIAEGKLADLVILDENPLENVANTKKVHAVVANGALLQREDLDTMLYGER